MAAATARVSLQMSCTWSPSTLGTRHPQQSSAPANSSGMMDNCLAARDLGRRSRYETAACGCGSSSRSSSQDRAPPTRGMRLAPRTGGGGSRPRPVRIAWNRGSGPAPSGRRPRPTTAPARPCVAEKRARADRRRTRRSYDARGDRRRSRRNASPRSVNGSDSPRSSAASAGFTQSTSVNQAVHARRAA